MKGLGLCIGFRIGQWPCGSDTLVRLRDGEYPTSQERTLTQVAGNMRAKLLLICAALFAVTAIGQQDDVRKRSVKLSTLPPIQQSAINSAIERWDRQFKWKAQENSPSSVGNASIDTVHLGFP